LNKTHLRCARLIEAILVFFNILLNIPIILTNGGAIMYAMAFYSLWGSTFAFVSHLASIIAMDYEGWFKFAYITTELSYAINVIVVFVFWVILWPWILEMSEG